MELIVSAGVIVAVVAWGVLAPEHLGAVFDTALAAITRNFGWFYLWIVFALVVVCLMLAVSRYGDLKLGTFFQFRRGKSALVSIAVQSLPWRPLRAIGTVAVPTLAAFVWFSVFGGTALNLEIMQDVPIAEAVKADVSTALFALFDALPYRALLSGAATVLVLVFFVTSGDSATLGLGMMSTGGNENPPARVKLIWGVLVSGVAITLLLAGGIKAVQTATIVFALPFTGVILLMAIALWRGVREDWTEQDRRERALRRLRQLPEPGVARHPGPPAP